MCENLDEKRTAKFHNTNAVIIESEKRAAVETEDGVIKNHSSKSSYKKDLLSHTANYIFYHGY